MNAKIGNKYTHIAPRTDFIIELYYKSLFSVYNTFKARVIKSNLSSDIEIVFNISENELYQYYNIISEDEEEIII